MKPLLNFLKTWNEAWLLFLCIPLIPFVPRILRLFDPTAAPVDAGVYHTLFITVLSFGVLHLFAWIGIKLNFSLIWDIFQNYFKLHFFKLTSWQRLLFCYLVFALYLLAIVATFAAVAGMV